MSDPVTLPGPNPPKEPLLTVGTITMLATAVVALVVSFGVHLDDDTQAAILGVVAVVAPIVVAWVGRSRVYSPASVRAVIRQVASHRTQVLPTTGDTVVRDVEPPPAR